MKITVINISHRDPSWLTDAIQQYQQRLPKHLAPTWLTLAPDANITREGERMLQKIPAANTIIALDEHGQEWTSAQLAEKLTLWQNESNDITFIIGGANGLTPTCKSRARVLWSLSKLTLPHQFVKLLLVEQLYRASTILTGHPYHRE